MKPIPEKLIARKEKLLKNIKINESGCWEWQGTVSPKGYGRIGFSTEPAFFAHRVFYAIYFGQPGNSLVCHRCDFPRCVNPEHLFLGTPLDNMRDMKAKGRDRNNPGGWQANYILMTPEKLEEMKLYYLSDTSLSTRDVARKFNMEAKHCWFWLKKAGIDIRRKKIPVIFSNKEMEGFKAMYDSGSRIKDIAIVMGLDAVTAAKRLKSYGIKIRDRNDRPTRFYRGEVVQK